MKKPRNLKCPKCGLEHRIRDHRKVGIAIIAFVAISFAVKLFIFNMVTLLLDLVAIGLGMYFVFKDPQYYIMCKSYKEKFQVDPQTRNVIDQT